jgi:hypothetical protein
MGSILGSNDYYRKYYFAVWVVFDIIFTTTNYYFIEWVVFLVVITTTKVLFFGLGNILSSIDYYQSFQKFIL